MNPDDILLVSINTLWNTPKATLLGICADSDGISDELIDRGQAIDEDGNAMYDFYTLELEISPDVRKYSERKITIDFAAKDMERYARTWIL